MRALERDLESLLGKDAIRSNLEAYSRDSTEMQGLYGLPDAVVAPATTDDVQRLVRWCFRFGVALIPRGGGTGFAGGAVPINGGVVCSLERMNRIVSVEPNFWRAVVEAGTTTARVHRVARDNGLYYPPDPGASEQSQIGGNIACNAGGPHSFKYGVTSAWVDGIEAVVHDGQVIQAGGPVRKDVAGLDIRGLLLGSEGTLGVITRAWLRLIPAPEASYPVVAAFQSLADGQAAFLDVYGSGVVPSVLEFLDRGALQASSAAFPGPLQPETSFLLIAVSDGTKDAAETSALDLSQTLEGRASYVNVLRAPKEIAELWRWRSGVSFAVSARRGGKMSEDVAVPVERLGDVVRLVLELGRRFKLPSCSWGHAGDGNVHATFMIDAAEHGEVARAEEACRVLFAEIRGMGGTVSGEHGLGWVKRDQFDKQFPGFQGELQRAIKTVFDPKGIFNPGKKFGDGVGTPLVGQSGRALSDSNVMEGR